MERIGLGPILFILAVAVIVGVAVSMIDSSCIRVESICWLPL
jgi:hypothetical protein